MRNCTKCGAALPIATGRGARRKMCATCSPSRPRRKPPLAPAVVKAVAAEPGTVTDATRAALVEAGALGTPMGQAALVLARRLDDDREPVSALAQATKQLAAALSSVVTAQRQQPVADPNDEFTRKRLARESGA